MHLFSRRIVARIKRAQPWVRRDRSGGISGLF
jgi:hypothetical protein